MRIKAVSPLKRGKEKKMKTNLDALNEMFGCHISEDELISVFGESSSLLAQNWETFFNIVNSFLRQDIRIGNCQPGELHRPSFSYGFMLGIAKCRADEIKKFAKNWELKKRLK